MEHRHKRYLSIIAALAISIIPCVSAAEPSAADPMELSLEENIETPAIPKRDKQHIKDRNEKMRNKLERAGFSTGRLRQGEVLMITIPCSQLFLANSTSLSDDGAAALRRLSLLDRHQSEYKMLIAVHADDTGDIEYSDSITAARANAIDDFVNDVLGLDSMPSIPYGIGRDEPLGANDSMKKRAANRRVEIYLVPQNIKK